MTGAVDDSPPLIELAGVTRAYALPGGATHQALRQVSLCIRAGESVAVLGKSGSGKSTLLNLLAGLDRADQGRVRVAGADLGRMSEDALARWRGRTLGIVFQFFQLLPTLTVAENLWLAMELGGAVPGGERRERAQSLLRQVGLADQAGKLPAALSGGQQQRVALARALANDPPLLLADEPTGNLDSESAEAVAALFAALTRQGKTLVIVTHDDALAAAAQRVLRLKDGAVVGDERRAQGIG